MLYRLKDVSFFSFLLFLIFATSCKSSKNRNGDNSSLLSIAEASFKEIPISKGKIVSTIKAYDHETDWKYTLSVPEIKKGEKVPLFISLHGGVASKNYTKFSNCLVSPAMDSIGIIFSPSGAWRNWNLEYLEKRILDVITLAKKHWPVDPEKIVLIGYSNGAIAGWKYAKKYDDIFSAMILMGSSCKVDDKIDIPIYVIQGTKDKFFPIKKIRKRLALARTLGCNITLVEAQGKTHIKACEYVEELKSSIPWLKNEVWTTM